MLWGIVYYIKQKFTYQPAEQNQSFDPKSLSDRENGFLTAAEFVVDWGGRLKGVRSVVCLIIALFAGRDGGRAMGKICLGATHSLAKLQFSHILMD